MGSPWLKLLGGLGLLKIMNKATTSKAVVIKINLIFFSFFLIAYAALLIWPSPSSSPSLLYGQLHRNVAPPFSPFRKGKMENSVKMKAVLEESPRDSNTMMQRKKMTKPRFIDEMMTTLRIGGTTIGMINMDESDISQWKSNSNSDTIIPIKFDRVSSLFEWKHLFPEWIDEEQDTEGGYLCPEIPMPNFDEYPSMDLIVVKLPCKKPEPGWARDVFRLQLHLVTANVMARKGKRDWYGKIKVVFWSECRPMVELFRCDDLEKREGEWWYYEVEAGRIVQKVALPIGSCNLALPLWGQEQNQVYDLTTLRRQTQSTISPTTREAYATVLHSSSSYVCGAIALAQSLLLTNTTRDLILLLDKSIPKSTRSALTQAGWSIRIIKRIRNPRAEKGSYNEYNYSKFRLWQQTNYTKIIFIDADVIALRNLDLLFHFPQLSAAGNDAHLFNSGVMVIEPSNCTFRILMEQRRTIQSYNGGDQGFLNEIFVWWHRLPRRINFLKNFWSNSTLEYGLKNHLFGSDPPQVYAVHYLGLKPWACYRDYDCNWDMIDQHVYASDVAHQRWWRVYDSMEVGLQGYCELSVKRRLEIDWERRRAKKMGFVDGHWRINVTDPRRQSALNRRKTASLTAN